MKKNQLHSFFCLLFITMISISVQAQRKVFLSGKNTQTAVNWDFKLKEVRNSSFWTTIPVPSNWETKSFGFYLYGMDKMEERIFSDTNWVN